MSARLQPILTAIAAKLAGLAFAVNGAVLPVLQRKAMARRQKLDPHALISVSKSAAAEVTSRRRFGLWQTAYVIDVVVLSPYTGPDATADQYAAIRDAIIDAFKAPPLAGAPAVFDMDAQPADWLRPFGEQTEYDWNACQITATVAHT